MHKQTDEIEACHTHRRYTSQRHMYRRAWGMVMVMVLLTSVALSWGQGSVFAQADAPTSSSSSESAPDSAPVSTTNEVTPDEVNAVARELWCPLCSGVRLDACELKACEQMKDMIAIKLSEGEDTASIKAYFVEQYGPQVMGEPPREGFNWLAWILPVVGLLVGGYVFWRTTQRMMRPVAPLGEGLASGVVLDATNASSVATSSVMPAPTDTLPTITKPPVSDNPDDIIDQDDKYTQKLEEELAKYG